MLSVLSIIFFKYLFVVLMLILCLFQHKREVTHPRFPPYFKMSHYKNLPRCAFFESPERVMALDSNLQNMNDSFYKRGDALYSSVIWPLDCFSAHFT